MARRKGETSYHDTAFGIIPRSRLIQLEIEGLKKAWDFVLQKRAGAKIPITPESLKQIHCVGFGWIFPECGGKFRTIDVEVSDHKPPKFFLAPQLMLDFCRDLNERLRYLPKIDSSHFLKQLIKILAWMHHRFLWIHPFKDYNGRIARLLTSVVLLNLDLPPIELKMETRRGRHKYIEALRAADHGDYKPLEELIEAALKEAAKEL